MIIDGIDHFIIQDAEPASNQIPILKELLC